MAIVRFTFDATDVPEGAVGVREVVENGNKYWVWHEYVGLCINDREINGYHDSDFYMTVWSEPLQKPIEIQYATTRGWTYPAMGSFVDATPEILAKYQAYQQQREIECQAAYQERVDKLPTKGKRVRVIKQTGGKDAPPKGIEGEVFWARPKSYVSRYMPSWQSAMLRRYHPEIERVGIKCADGKRYFCNVGSIELI